MENIQARSCVTLSHRWMVLLQSYQKPLTGNWASETITGGHTQMSYFRRMRPNQLSLKSQKSSTVPWIQQSCTALEYWKTCFLGWLGFFLKHDPGQDLLIIAIIIHVPWSETFGMRHSSQVLLQYWQHSPRSPAIYRHFQAWTIMGLPTRNCGIPMLQCSDCCHWVLLDTCLCQMQMWGEPGDWN